MPTVTGTCVQDAVGRLTGTANFSNTENYCDLYTHTSDGNARIFGWRFTIPDSIDPDDIEDARLVLEGVSGSGTPQGNLTVESDATTALAAGFHSRWAAAAAENGTVEWDPVAADGVADSSCPNFGDELASAITNSTPAGGVYTVCVFWKSDLGSPAFARYASLEHATYDTPSLSITTTAPVDFTAALVDGLVTDDADQVFADVLLDEDVDYTGVSALGTGSGAGANRILDVYPPRSGEMPSAGWPAVVFVHGGRWTSGNKSLGASENNLPRYLVDLLTANGIAVVSVEYRKMEEEVATSAIDRSFPMNVHDVIAAMEYIGANADDYDLDSTKLILSGMSAGGYLALFAAIAIATGDSTVYEGRQNSGDDRPAGYGFTDAADPWQFDLDEDGQLVAPTPAGIMVWDAPVDIYELTTIAGPAGDLNASARQALFGEATFTTVPAGEDEVDLNHYIAGNGTTYTVAKSAAALPPIFFMYGTNEDLVENDASIGALEAALDAISYDTSTADGVLNETGGLTKYAVARDHEDVLRESDLTAEMEWLTSVLTDDVLPVTLGASPITAVYLGSTPITGIALGSVTLWP